LPAAVSGTAEHDQGVLGKGGQRGDELAALVLLRARGEDLLELVHDDRGGLVTPQGEPRVPLRVLAQPLGQQPGAQRALGPRPGQRRQLPGQGLHRRGARRDQYHRAAARPGRGAGPQPGDQARPQQRGLTGPGGPDHRERQPRCARPGRQPRQVQG
jgi:hypothetical protein